MLRFAEAAEDYREVLLLQPNNREAQGKLEAVQHHLHSNNGSA